VIPISRAWATPVTMGAFFVMVVTGGLMFFHLDSGLNKAAHEWLGWLLVAAVVAHGMANWLSLKHHLVASRRAQLILAASVFVLACSFVALGGGEAAPPPLLTLQAVSRAPLNTVLPLTGKSLAQARIDLAAAGLSLRDGEQSLQDLSGGNRGTLGRAVRALFAPPG
jgi:hypothetical protein